MKVDRDSLYAITQSILAVMVVVVSFYAILFGSLDSADGIYSIIGIVIGYYFSSLNSTRTVTVNAQNEEVK
jgi:type IV secretory pathway VirB2 component (pilin)